MSLLTRMGEFTANPTENYTTSSFNTSYGLMYAMNGEPWFSWFDVPLMLQDPAILFGLDMLRSPFSTIELDEKSLQKNSDPRVVEYIKSFFYQFWKRGLPRLIDSYNCWGRGVLGMEYRYSKRTKLLSLHKARHIEACDATPQVYTKGPNKGRFAGVNLRNMSSDQQRVYPRYVFYYAGRELMGPYCDRPAIAGAATPWKEHYSPGGARASRRLFYWTKAVGMTTIRYPDGKKLTGPNGQEIDAQDAARQVGELMMNGAVVSLPNTRNEQVEGKYEWEIEQHPGQSDTAGVLEYCDKLDKEKWRGMGIQEEIVIASERGSGYSGRSIPMESWYAKFDDEAGRIWGDVREQHLDRLMRQNFGIREYDADLTSLLKDFRNADKPEQQGNQGQQQPGQQGPEEIPDDLAGMLGASGGEGDQAGVNLSNVDERRTTPNRLHAAIASAMIDAKLRQLMGQDNDGEADDMIRWLSTMHDPEESSRALGAKLLAWESYGVSRGGSQRWKDTDTGKVRYQKSKPGEHAERRAKLQADAKRGSQIVGKVMYGENTPEELEELETHIHAMTVPQLRATRERLQASFQNAKQRGAMVKALTDHVRSRMNEASEPEDKPSAFDAAKHVDVFGNDAVDEIRSKDVAGLFNKLGDKKHGEALAEYLSKERPDLAPTVRDELAAYKSPRKKSQGVKARPNGTPEDPKLKDTGTTEATQGEPTAVDAGTTQAPEQPQPGADAIGGGEPEVKPVEPTLPVEKPATQPEATATEEQQPGAAPDLDNPIDPLNDYPMFQETPFFATKVAEAEADKLTAEASKTAANMPTPENAPTKPDRSWTKNEDGTYTAFNGQVWKIAAAGGEVSPVTGEMYQGGRFMPIHGGSVGAPKQPKGKGVDMGDGAKVKEDDGEKRQPRKDPLTPEEIESKRARAEEQRKFIEASTGPISKMTWLGERLNQKSGGHDFPKYRDWLRTQPPGTAQKLIGQLEPYVHGLIDADATARGLPLNDDGVVYEKNSIKDFANENLGILTGAKKLEKEHPGAVYAEALLRHALYEQNHPKGTAVIERIHRANEVLKKAIATTAKELTGRAKEDHDENLETLLKQVDREVVPRRKLSVATSVLEGLHPDAQKTMVQKLFESHPDLAEYVAANKSAIPPRMANAFNGAGLMEVAKAVEADAGLSPRSTANAIREQITTALTRRLKTSQNVLHDDPTGMIETAQREAAEMTAKKVTGIPVDSNQNSGKVSGEGTQSATPKPEGGKMEATNPFETHKNDPKSLAESFGESGEWAEMHGRHAMALLSESHLQPKNKSKYGQVMRGYQVQFPVAGSKRSYSPPATSKAVRAAAREALRRLGIADPVVYVTSGGRTDVGDRGEVTKGWVAVGKENRDTREGESRTGYQVRSVRSHGASVGDLTPDGVVKDIRTVEGVTYAKLTKHTPETRKQYEEQEADNAARKAENDAERKRWFENN